MSKLKIFDYKGSPIQFEEVNGKIMANATLMAQSHGKNFKDWYKTDKVKDYIDARRTKLLLTEREMVVVKNGGNDNGSWIHESLILRFAQWLSTDFEIWCDEKIAELLKTGKTELKPMSQAEMLFHSSKLLLEHDQQLIKLTEKVHEIDAKITNIPCDHYTAAGYGKLVRVSIDKTTAQKVGRRATKLCKELGYQICTIPDSKYATINIYHKDVLETVFIEMGLKKAA